MLAALSLFSAAARAQATLPPTITKSFGTVTLDLTATTSLSFTVGNPNPATDLTGVGFTDTLPSGLVISTPNGLTSSCGGGTITAVAGSSDINLSGAILTKAASCTLRVNVTGVQLGFQNNVTGVVTAIESGPGGTAKASVTVVVPGPPQVSATKTFTPATIDSGGTATLTIALSNNSVNNDADLLAFSDTFPAGMTVAPGARIDTCSAGGMTVTASKITVNSGFIGADGGTCMVSVPVTAIAAVANTLTNVTSAFTCTNPAGTLCSGKPASADLVVIGVGIPPGITSGSPPNGTVGVAYAFALTATGAPAPTFSASGQPPGLSIAPGTSQISGTPTQPGSFAVTIVASNGVAPDDSRNYTIVINPPLAIGFPGGDPTLPGGTTGVPYGPVTFTGSGGTPPYTWNVCKPSLPPGLAFSIGGTLSGTPTQAGTFAFDVCLKDSQGATTSKSVTVVVVKAGATMSMSITPNPAVSGVPIDVAAKITGGSASATGVVQFWVAGTGTRCPIQFAAGAPGNPEAAMRTATLDANGRAQLTYPSLRIDDYLVCAQYLGDGFYLPASVGPDDLFVIKGVLLPPPTVTLGVAAQGAPSAKIVARIAVIGAEAAPVPQGSVRVRLFDSEIASGDLVNGSVVIAFDRPAGAMTLTADYSGDGLYPPASSDSTTVEAGEILAAGGGGAPVIPTLQQWALYLLTLILATLGWRRLRRR